MTPAVIFGNKSTKTAGQYEKYMIIHGGRVSQLAIEREMNANDQTQNRIGYFYVVLAAVLFGISGTAAKFLFNAGVTAFQLIQMRTTLAFVVLLIWLIFRRPDLLKISVKKLPYFFCLGVLGIGSAQFFYLLAISKISVAPLHRAGVCGPVCCFCSEEEAGSLQYIGDHWNASGLFFGGGRLQP